MYVFIYRDEKEVHNGIIKSNEMVVNYGHKIEGEMKRTLGKNAVIKDKKVINKFIGYNNNNNYNAQSECIIFILINDAKFHFYLLKRFIRFLLKKKLYLLIYFLAENANIEKKLN